MLFHTYAEAGVAHQGTIPRWSSRTQIKGVLVEFESIKELEEFPSLGEVCRGEPKNNVG
jgi:hypothetical protein